MHLFIPSPAGRLEAILTEPQNFPRQWAVVLCHPHPLFGGTLHTKAIFRSARALQSLGMATLQFNFRGVGQSTGTYDEGRGEKDDVGAALDFLQGRYPGLSLGLLGFSFGAWVGLQVGASDERIRQLIGLGVPIRKSDFSFFSACAKPKLIVQGEFDEFGPRAEVEAWFSTLAKPKRLSIVEGSTHLFEGRIAPLQSAILQYFQEMCNLPPLHPL